MDLDEKQGEEQGGEGGGEKGKGKEGGSTEDDQGGNNKRGGGDRMEGLGIGIGGEADVRTGSRGVETARGSSAGGGVEEVISLVDLVRGK